MDLQLLSGRFSVCKVTKITAEMMEQPFSFSSVTDEECSLICRTENVPKDCLLREDDWCCFRIAEDASFQKYGMISFLAKVIASQKTATLVVGTYDTDYLFVKEDKFVQVKQQLLEEGCRFI
ncbi:MAG: ACT domain-containing protein [Selenomonadaceae bacterium]